MKGKERAELRAEAHHLRPLVHVGQQGVTDTVRQSLDEALRARELVKVHFARDPDLDLKSAAADLASSLGAEVIQVIGRTTTLYRENPELERRPGAEPPWRR